MQFDNEEEKVRFERTLGRALKLINDMMPGVAHISLPDYALANDAPLELISLGAEVGRAPAGKVPLTKDSVLTVLQDGAMTIKDALSLRGVYEGSTLYMAKRKGEGLEAVSVQGMETVDRGNVVLLFTKEDVADLVALRMVAS